MVPNAIVAGTGGTVVVVVVDVVVVLVVVVDVEVVVDVGTVVAGILLVASLVSVAGASSESPPPQAPANSTSSTRIMPNRLIITHLLPRTHLGDAKKWFPSHSRRCALHTSTSAQRL
jgi:hypothetical protein